MDFSIEEMTMNAWPSIQTILFDGWIIRMAGGYTKRANSVNPIYSYENDARANSISPIYSCVSNMDEKINYCEKLYKENNLPTIFKIIECDEYKKLDKRLDELNYEKVDLTCVQIYDGINQNNSKMAGVIIGNKFSDDWKNCFYQCSNIENLDTIKTIEKMLENVKHKIISVYKLEKGTFVGCGYGIIERDFVGLFDIIVREEFRGKGYGKEIVEAILLKAKETGVNKAYLAVVNDNIIAKTLYGKIGFKEIYKYWYRKKV
jgi:GNAT superfamily N-acetyltransferase/tetrahydromethanopterin S-methyltransferase subunit G